MPISRYQIRNVYSLADPDLYKAADKDDPEALLEGVAMAGLVGVLRQLGDLADFAAEIFHNLHEEVTATAARGHGLQERVQQLELEIPSIERAFLSQTCHSAFFPNSGIDWHPNKQTSQNHITTGDLPRFVMDSYEECRGPPRLFLLDKFDVGGAGACLKRYSDPSFYKVEVSSYENESTQNQRDKKIRKIKKKGSQGKEGGTPEISPTSRVKLHQLFLEDRVQNGTTEPTRRVKLKNRPNKSPFDSETGESYMNKLLNTPSESKIVHPVHIRPSIVPVPFSTSNQSEPEIFKDTIISPSNSTTQSRSPSVSSTDRRNLVAGKVIGRQVSGLTSSTSSEVDEKKINEEIGTNGVQNGDDVASEIENYVDALASMESEVETEGGKRNNSSNSTEIAAIVGTTEIPFCSRVSPEKIPGTHACIDVNQGLRLEEGKDDENLGNEDFLSPAGSLFSLKFYLNCEGELDNEETNEGSSPVIHVPNILETSDRISEDNQSTGSVRSRCSSSHAVISRVDEQQPFGVSLEEHNFVVEGASDSRDTYSLPENQLKEIGDDDDVLHISDSAKPEDSYFSQDEKGSKRSEIETLTDAVSDLDDVHRSGGLKERETGLGNSEIKVGGDAMSVPDDVDKNDDNALSTLEDDTQLEGREEDFVVSEIEKIAAVLLAADVNKNDNEDSKESDEKEEVDQPLVISQDSDSAPYDDSSRKPLLDSIPNTSLVVSDDDDNSSFCQDQTHFFLAKPDKKGQQAAVLHYLENHESESKSMTQGDDIDTSEATQLSHVENKVDPQLLLASGTHETHLDTHSVNLLSQSVLQEDLQEKPVSVSVPDKPPTFELPLMNGHEVKNVDQVNHQFHSDPYEVNLPSQSEEDPQEKPTIVSVSESVTSHGTDPFDQVKHQSHSDPDPVSLTTKSILHEKIPEGKPMTKSVPVPDKPPTLELPQASSHDTNLFDQVKHQSPPVFPVFNILPETPPVKLEDAPPLPPLPPMQWRTRKLQSPSLTPTNGGQHSDHNFPPIFQSKPNDVAGPTPLFDEIKNPETENEKLKNEGSLETEDHDKSSEEKFKENLVPQAAVETDSDKSSSTNLIPQNDEIVSGVRPLKIQRPRSPLIDAVAAHDKTKLRKVSDRATSQIPKGQENDKLLEQIRTKSYNLKPAVKTRPIVHGPTTNVRLAAILEKANAIRHAFAGSDDDDDDSDSWSDS